MLNWIDRKSECVKQLVFAALILGLPHQIKSSVRRAESARKKSLLTNDEKKASIKKFESECRSWKHNHCKGCRMVSLNLTVNKNGLCSPCSSSQGKDSLLDRKLLPIWLYLKL